MKYSATVDKEVNFNNKKETVKMAKVINVKKVSPVNGKFNLLVSGDTKDINLLARLGKLVFDAGMKYKGIEVICPREVSHYVYQIVKPNVKNGFHFTIGNHLTTMAGISAVVVLADNELSDTQVALVGYLDKMEKAPAYRIISNKKKEEKKEEKVAVKESGSKPEAAQPLTKDETKVVNKGLKFDLSVFSKKEEKNDVSVGA